MKNTDHYQIWFNITKKKLFKFKKIAEQYGYVYETYNF